MSDFNMADLIIIFLCGTMFGVFLLAITLIITSKKSDASKNEGRFIK